MNEYKSFYKTVGGGEGSRSPRIQERQSLNIEHRSKATSSHIKRVI